jgi:hypothetical protein
VERDCYGRSKSGTIEKENERTVMGRVATVCIQRIATAGVLRKAELDRFKAKILGPQLQDYSREPADLYQASGTRTR